MVGGVGGGVAYEGDEEGDDIDVADGAAGEAGDEGLFVGLVGAVHGGGMSLAVLRKQGRGARQGEVACVGRDDGGRRAVMADARLAFRLHYQQTVPALGRCNAPIDVVEGETPL